jgi:hypothetical protein
MLIFCVLFLLFYILFVLVEDNRDEGGVVFYPADSVHAILKVQCHQKCMPVRPTDRVC